MNPQDLFNDIKAMKAQLDELSKRPAPATAEQLEQVTDRPITLDAKSFAQHVLPDLKKGLPDTVAIEQAIKRLASSPKQQIRHFNALSRPRNVSPVMCE